MPGDHHLTLKQACDILGKKERTVRRYVQTGLLSKTYVDGDNGWELRLSEAEVRALASGTPLPRDAAPVAPGVPAASWAERREAETLPGEDAVPYVAAQGIVISPDTGAEERRARTAWAARRRDDPGDLRLQEAFGRYFELVQREYEAGRDAYLLGMEEIAQEERRGDPSAPGKGVRMLHVLRRALGDEQFWPALERFAQRHGFDQGTPDDLLRVLEEAAEEPIASRFEPWLRSPGLPQLSVAWRWDPEASSARLMLAQTPESDGPSFYPLATTVLFAGPRGPQTFPLTMTQSQEEFSFRLDARPRLVLVDPAHDLAFVIQASGRMEEWLEQLRRGPDALHRVRAIHGLRGAWGAPEVEAALREAVQDDPCGGVRAAAARALAPAAETRSPSGAVQARTFSHHGGTENTEKYTEETLGKVPSGSLSPCTPPCTPPCLRGEETVSSEQRSGFAEGEIEAVSPGAPLSVGAEVEQLKRELRRLRAEQAQIERRLLLLELRTRPRVSETRAGPLPEECDANAGSLPPGGPAIA
jgi:hypothetical protein